MTGGRRASILLCLSAAGLAATPPASADVQAADWKVEDKLLGKIKDGKQKKAEDVSGLACMEATGFPRHCLLIDDETQSAQIVILKDGSLLAGASIPLISDVFEGKPLELDGEGVAYANGAFYVIGSHGHPRDAKRDLDPVQHKDKIAASIAAVSVVLRIPMTPKDVDDKGQITGSVKAEPLHGLRMQLKEAQRVSSFVDVRLDENGLTIEGLAIKGKSFFAGLRAPLLGEAAVVVETPLDALSGEAAGTKPTVHEIALGKQRGVRDLVAVDDGFLILAGPSKDPDKMLPIATGDYALFRWDGAAGLQKIADLDGRKKDDGEWVKPEAVLPLGGSKFLILSDGAEQGGPRVVTGGSQ